MDPYPVHSAVWARKLIETLRRRSVPVSRLLEEAGVEPRLLGKDDAVLPMDRVATLYELAADHTGDDSLAFHFAQTVEPRDTGLLAYVGLSAPTVGDAMINISRYRGVFSDAAEIVADTLYDDGVLSWDFRLPEAIKRRQYVELQATVLLRMLRMMSGREIRPAAVGFKYPRNSNYEEYQRFFGCDVRFGAGENFMRFRLEDLHIPLQTADDRLHRILTRHCEDVLARRAGTADTIIHRVERLAADRLSKGEATLENIATQLGMSDRTLARRLSEAGTSFKAVIDELRHALALRYLQNSDLTLTVIAFLLGYSEVSSFNHAFRRWTGGSPRAYRARSQN